MRTSWRSFDPPATGHAANGRDDLSYFMRRHEVHCDSRLGRAYPDGARTTAGRPYCINGVALIPKPDDG
jgi:peptide-methionine (R)-S-oxide reductase